MDLQQIHQNYPLHYYIWNNAIKELKRCLDTEQGQNALESRDIRGRTPLMLAVALGHFECVRLLLVNSNANVNVDDQDGFNLLHNAIASNDVELVQLVMEKRDAQRSNKRLHAIPALLKKIRDTPDFYLEMKWEFSSWVPLVSRFFPSDTYKIYKSGSSVRVDTTLSGFDQMNWHRGSRSYIFSAYDDSAKFIDIDHDSHQAHIENMVLAEIAEPINQFFSSSSGAEMMVQARLTCPTSITFLDTEKIVFERTKSGIPGFRSEKTENINGYDCKCFTANNVQVVTKVRTEHLSEQDKQNYKEQVSAHIIPFHSLLGTVETVEKPEKHFRTSDLQQQSSVQHTQNACNPTNVTLQEYFDPEFDMTSREIGRPKELTTRVNRFKANLWLSETFPLSLQEQVLPIIEILSITSSHFTKLKDFITLQIPAGFPVKIEIPLFHIVNARITFGNIFSLTEPVNGVTAINDKAAVACVVDEGVFEIPSHYSTSHYGNHEDVIRPRHIEEIDYIRFQNNSNRSSDLNGYYESDGDRADEDLQRAIAESLKDMHRNQLQSSKHQSSDDNTSGLTVILSPSYDVENGNP